LKKKRGIVLAALPAMALPATVLPATVLPAMALPATVLPATVLPATVLPGAVRAADLVVAVTGVRNDKGNVHVDICTKETFLKDCAWSGDAPARAGTTIVTVRNLPPGRYAAQAFHDENRNGKVDRGLFGIPKEGVGFSNDAKIRMAPPKFAEAMFDFAAAPPPAAPQRITFSLRYF